MKYLLIKGAAGLGNRILGTATGLLYAEITGRRPIVDWSDPRYSSDGSNVFGRYFVCPSAGSMEEISPTASVAPAIWRGRLDDQVEPVRQATPAGSGPASWAQSCVDLMRTDHPEDLLVMWSYRQRIEWLRPHLRGDHARFARRSTGAILKHVMETSMPPRPEIADRVAAFRREHLGGPTVGVHARATDLRTRLDAIRGRLQRLLAKEDDLQVFLATDNAEVRDEFERAYGAVSAPHWYAEPGVALHYSPDSPDATEVGLEALVDLYLLAGCDHLIFDRRSSFSEAAMVLTDAPRSRITDVEVFKKSWPVPLRALWRYTVPGPATPLAVSAARRWAR